MKTLNLLIFTKNNLQEKVGSAGTHGSGGAFYVVCKLDLAGNLRRGRRLDGPW